MRPNYASLLRKLRIEDRSNYDAFFRKGESYIPGRPSKTPPYGARKQFGALTAAVADVRKILKESTDRRDCPRDWGDREIGLILSIFNCPTLLDSDQKSALDFARLFAHAPNTMINALPKIRKRIERLTVGGMNAVMAYYGIICDVGRFNESRPNDEKIARFWREKTNVVCDDVHRIMCVKVTPKDVEHARRELRSFLGKRN